MLRITTLSLVTALSAGLVSEANAAVIYEASSTNTTEVVNGITGAAAVMSGDSAGAGNLTVNLTGNNFSAGGFASTQNINTLLGAALADTDVLTIQFTLDSISDGAAAGAGEIRSGGIGLGLVGGNTTRRENGSLYLAIGGAANSGASFLISDITSLDSGSFVANNVADSNDGFGVTIVADVDGWTMSFTGLAAATTAVTGTFDAGEFASLGNDFLTVDAQHRFGGVDLVLSEASIDVSPVPEPSSLALLGLGGLAMIRRRRCS